ncbi:LIME1 protein, partial [Centropus bengalensis]|nr:LIME1 protein [Centropus bengalensis]
MAAAGGEGLARTPLLPASAVLALLSILVYLGALCAACRRKGRKKKVPLDGVKLVDESLLRRAQLRSLSKSDTKLHELYRVKPSGDAQRPASLDIPGAGSPALLQHRQLPRPPEPPEQTYSNLPLPALRPPGRGEDAPLPPAAPGRSPLRPGGPDYACVRKVKQTVLVEEQDDARRAQVWGVALNPPAFPLQLEEMYSTVCKATRKKAQVPTSSPGE